MTYGTRRVEAEVGRQADVPPFLRAVQLELGAAVAALREAAAALERIVLLEAAEAELAEVLRKERDVRPVAE